jgi:hypothetical protein
LDPQIFKGTLFEAGGVGQHGGVEYWFNGLDDLKRLRKDPAWERIKASDARRAARRRGRRCSRAVRSSGCSMPRAILNSMFRSRWARRLASAEPIQLNRITRKHRRIGMEHSITHDSMGTHIDWRHGGVTGRMGTGSILG